MRVLVTGGAGYIGSVMCRALVDSGHDVLVLDNLAQGHRQAITGLGLVTADLQDLARVVEACKRFKPEGCMHFAARNLVGESMQVPLEYFENNVGGTINLLRALVESGSRWMVFSSSAATYGNPTDGSHIDEDAPRIPVNPYGKAKLMVEGVLGELDRVGDLRYVSLRYFNAAGADTDHDLGEDHSPETHLIPNVISAALGKTRGVSVFGTDYPTSDGTCLRDYIHIVDLARAHLLALEHLSEGGASRVFNLGNGNGFSVKEVIAVVQEVSGTKFQVTEGPRRPGDPPVLVASSDRIRAELGWHPLFGDLRDIVESAWTWHGRHPAGYM
ncbi:MAG TPA: UDP-glucose 4-epimerase GalE [Candidatus Anoxymicrobiaceae bacterium]|jgi:UDP-glucose 4-epimerase